MQVYGNFFLSICSYLGKMCNFALAIRSSASTCGMCIKQMKK